MDEAAIPGQGRAAGRRLIARAARALSEDGAVSTEGLLAAYRAAAPANHAGATHDIVDAAFLARARALGGDALLAARALRLTSAPWRAAVRIAPADDDTLELLSPPREDRAGDALLLLLGVSLEAAKLAHGLPVPPESLRAAFPNPTAAQDALAALREGGDARLLEQAPGTARIEAAALAALVGDRPCYLVTGAGAARLHDLLSPFARRLRAPLVELAGRLETAPPRDEAAYLGLEALLDADADVLAERLEAERADACVPVGEGAIAVRCEALPDGEVDRRCRESAAQLKRARALLVLVEPNAESVAEALRVLGASARALAVVTEGNSACTPAALRDEATGHVALVDNALPDAAGTLCSLPSLALADGGPGADASAFALTQPLLTARAQGVLDARARLAIRSAPTGDAAALSRACIDLLARFAPGRPARARAR